MSDEGTLTCTIHRNGVCYGEDNPEITCCEECPYREEEDGRTMKTDNAESASQRLKEYEEAERLEYIQRCEKCGSLKITAYVDENYFSNPLRYSCKCGNTWAG